MAYYGYCTKCDKDVFNKGSPCAMCMSAAHIVEPDLQLKCTTCQRTWTQHGSPASASACISGFTVHFTPLPCAPLGYTGSPTIMGVDYAASDAARTLALDSQHRIKCASGMKCSRCGDFNNFATSNQADGTFVCYICRQ